MSQTIQPTPRPASRPRRRRGWRTLVAIVLVVALAIGAALLLAQCVSGGNQAAANRFRIPSITVGVATATLGDVPITVTALGTVTPEQTVSVIPRVTGQLADVRFTEGQMVQKGEVLAIIDPAPFQAALDQAKGTLAHDEANLAGAQRDLARYQTLVAQNSIARQTEEDQLATVRQDEGVVVSDKGQVATAQLNLTWSRIVSPVSGRVGLRQIDAGNQVTANGTTPIAVVTQIDPIDVIFAVPEDAIPSIVRHPDFGAGVPVTAYDRAGGAALGTGSLTTIDNVVDTTTGTVKGKARFANPGGALFPNQFVNITVLVDTLKKQVIVPTTAIRHGPNGDFVWVLQSEDNTVKERDVKSGPGTGETTSIVSGLAAGEIVITDGGDRLRDGAAVTLPKKHTTSGGGGAGAGALGDSEGSDADAALARADRNRRPSPPMSPSRPFIQRPVATSLLMLAVLLAGLVAFHFLSLSALPEVDYPTIQVQTSYPGGSPEVMAETVTAPLERQFGQMADLNRMSSVSSGGSSVITLQFNLDLSLDVAEQEVQASINAAGNLLPVDLPAPPIYAKVNPADAPIITLALTSKTMPLTDVQSLAEEQLGQKISQIAGVGLVTIAGGERPAVRIQVHTRQLAAYGLTLESLRTVIAAANANQAKGSFDGPTRAYAINGNDQLEAASDYADQIIAYKNGDAIRLKDVATIISAAENDRLAAYYDAGPVKTASGTTPANLQQAIVLNVQRQPGANVITTVDKIKAELPDLTSSLPAGLNVTVVTDRTTGIRASVNDVEFELVLAIVLVVAVIFLFLRSLPATFIAGVAAPLSIVGTFGVMYLLGYSLNNLTLMSLTIATGFVVDDAIVMIENIARYIEAGERPLQAALRGAEQIGFTIISLTVSLIAVLIPLLFMGDVVGRLFRQFAVTLAVTIVISAFISLTLTPTLSAIWLRPAEEARESKFGRRAAQLIDDVIARYGRALDWVLARQTATLLVALATLALTVLLYFMIPKGLFPTQDTGLVQGVTVAGQSVSYARMGELQQQVAAALVQDPDVASLTSYIGVDGVNTTQNSGRYLINLKPLGERTSSQAATLDRLRKIAEGVPGMTLYLQPVQDLTIDANVSRTQYQFSLEGPDQTTINTWAANIVAALSQDKKLRNVGADVQDQGLSAYIAIDRDTAARLAITPSTVDDALYDAFGQRIISTIFTESNQYRVILEADPNEINTPQGLSTLYMTSGGGAPTPLGAISTVTTQLAPLQINHVAQFPAANISFDTAPGVSLGDAVSAIQADEAKLKVPAVVTTTFLGAADAYQASLSNELWLILAAIVCVYIVLGVLYESYIHPITILSTLPSAGVGALLALMICGSDLGVIGIIGIILLIGIVKKNAIMMIDFALDAERQEGKPPLEAIRQAALLRFRPIIMTTLAALFAALPLMLGWGEGSELRRPLGISIFGGLIVSQALTLFTTPVIYLWFDRLGRRFGFHENMRKGEADPRLDEAQPQPGPAE